MACAFNPIIVVNFGNDESLVDFYRDWLRNLLLHFETLNRDDIQKKAYQFYSHLLQVSTIIRDPLWIRLDQKILDYFHLRGELLFKKSVDVVKKSHENKYVLKIGTRYGDIQHKFSSIRECREVTGLDFRKQLRRILY